MWFVKCSLLNLVNNEVMSHLAEQTVLMFFRREQNVIKYFRVILFSMKVTSELESILSRGKPVIPGW